MRRIVIKNNFCQGKNDEFRILYLGNGREYSVFELEYFLIHAEAACLNTWPFFFWVAKWTFSCACVWTFALKYFGPTKP
jgi:hypothetical protein